MNLAIWQKGNMLNCINKTFTIDNARSESYAPSPKIPIKPNTDYTLVVEYSNLSFTLVDGGTYTLGFGIGHGVNSYSSDIVYRQVYPKSATETSGKVVCSFNTKNCGEGRYLHFRPIRQNDYTTGSITWDRAMVLEGVYTEDTVPDFIPYTDGKPLIEKRIRSARIWSKKSANRLPEGYTELEYIESDGRQYMKTGITVTGNTRVKAKMMCLEKNKAGSYAYLFGSKTPLFSFRMHWSNGLPYCTYGSTTSITFYSDGVGDVLNINFGSGVSTVNDYKKNVGTAEFTDGELHIFDCDNAASNTRGKGRMWEFEVYEGETIVGDFVPCINPDNVVGAYDLVTGVFQGSATSSAFIAGPAFETKIKNIRIGGSA